MVQNTYYRASAQGTILYVKVKTKSKHDKIVGIIEESEKTYLSICVKAIAEDGKANKSVLKLISKTFKIPIANISIKTGTRSTIKQIFLDNVDANVINLPTGLK